MLEELKTLTLLNGPSGYEDEVRKYLKEKFQQYASTYIDIIGNIIAKKGKGERKILVTAHMDEVGFIIQSIDENGFIKFTSIGGWDERIVAGMPVKILADFLSALKGRGFPFQSDSLFPSLIRNYISHLRGSRVAQRTTPIYFSRVPRF